MPRRTDSGEPPLPTQPFAGPGGSPPSPHRTVAPRKSRGSDTADPDSPDVRKGRLPPEFLRDNARAAASVAHCGSLDTGAVRLLGHSRQFSFRRLGGPDEAKARQPPHLRHRRRPPGLCPGPPGCASRAQPAPGRRSRGRPPGNRPLSPGPHAGALQPLVREAASLAHHLSSLQWSSLVPRAFLSLAEIDGTPAPGGHSPRKSVPGCELAPLSRGRRHFLRPARSRSASTRRSTASATSAMPTRTSS